MKKFAVYLLVACLVLVNISAAFAGVSLSAFPDPVFREHLKRYDNGWKEITGYDQQGYPIWTEFGRDNGILDDKELEGITEIYVEPGTISLKGIEYLTALSYLNCGNHQITELDVSHNTALKQLICSYTPLTELDVSNCSALEVLLCDTSQLTTLKLGNLSALTSILCQNNQLTELDVRGCPALKSLDCSNNKLTKLNVSGCSALENLQCYNNQLTELDVRGCPALKSLDCRNNQLTKLNTSGCTSLVRLACQKNDFIELDVSNLTALKDLSCYCDQMLILKASGCTSLENFYYYDNYNYKKSQLAKLDVSGCTALIDVRCYNNSLTELNVSGCSALENLQCDNNQLTELDVNGCSALEILNCYDNQLTKLNTSGCTSLVRLACQKNDFIELDVRNLTALKDLRCYENHLTELDISGCTALTDLNCYNNQLIKLNASGCSALKYLRCDKNKLTELNLSGCSALTDLVCTTNKITKLDLSGCTALENLYCQINELTELDLSKCTALKYLDCLWNHIAELDLSKNTQLNDDSLSYGHLNQIIKDLKVTQTSEGYEVHLKDYVSKLENIDSDSVWGEDNADGFVRYDKTTGIALFSSYPKKVGYHYNTHSNGARKDFFMYVEIKSPMGVAVLERENEYNNLIEDMNDNAYIFRRYNNYFDNEGDILTEDRISSFSAAQYGKIGFAADGNSRLILRVQTEHPGRVTFSLNNDIGATLEQLTNRKNKSTSLLQVNTTEMNSELYQASAVLVAPETFPNKKNFPSDEFKINVQFTPDDPEEDSDEENIELKIEAAPVLLIPGIFDDVEKTFGFYKNSGVWAALINGNFDRNYIDIWNYDKSQGANEILANDYNDLFNRITRMLNQYAYGGIVCTKVDIIAHGMGGLLVRKFLSEERKDSRDGNNWSVRSYKQGMVRRLITVATPHLGTPWADTLDRRRFLTDMYKGILNNPYYRDHPLIQDILSPVTLVFNTIFPSVQLIQNSYIFTGSAWKDMQTTSPRSYGLPAGVPMHAIYGKMNTDGLAKDFWALYSSLVSNTTGAPIIDIYNLNSVSNYVTLSQFLLKIAQRFGFSLEASKSKIATKAAIISTIVYAVPSLMRIVTDIWSESLFNSQTNDLIVTTQSATAAGKIASTGFVNEAFDPLNPKKNSRYSHWSICLQNDVGQKIVSLLKGSTSEFTILNEEMHGMSIPENLVKSSISLDDINIDDTKELKFVNSLKLSVTPSVIMTGDNSQVINFTVTSAHSVTHDIYCFFENDNITRFFKLPVSNNERTKFEAKFNEADLLSDMENGIIEISCLSCLSNDSGIYGLRISNTANVALLDNLSNINIISLDFNAGTTLYTNKDSETPAGLYAIDENGNYYDISSPLNGTEWTSKNESIARINQNGCVQALEEGSTTLTAKFKNLTASINITVGPAIVYDDDNESDLQIITESLDKAFTGKKYNFTLKASESNNIKWSHKGELPPGLDLNESGLISGTPTKSGNYTFTVTASNGTDSASKKFTMIVSASGTSLEITTTTLKNGTDGKKYSVSLKAKGAKSLTWSAENLPYGLTINPSKGKISGTPKEYGDFNVIITASNGTDSIQKNFSLVINPVLPKFSGKLPAGNVYKEYSSSPLKISKGSEPITWSIKESLPLGLSFDVNTGIISGTPTQGFNGKITIVATNAAGEYANKLTLKITAEKPAITSINNYGLKSAIIGENYIISCAGTGTPPLSWDFSGFPESMSYDVKTGILSGIINQSGKFKININLSNSSGKTAKKKYSLQVYNPPAIITDSLPEATYKAKYNAVITATGDKKISWRAQNLPSGLKFSSKGKFSGTPTAAPGNYEIIITAYNDKIPAEYSRRETSQNFKLIINNNPDPKKAYTAPQNSSIANNNASDSESSSKLESEIINEPEKIISSNENLFIDSERDINSLNINISDDYIVAAVLPEIHVNKSGLYELEIELDENAQTNSKLYWLACPQNNNPSEDDSIAEFYDESGQEIFAVPENKLIIVSAWLNEGVIYAPVILVSK